MTEQQVKDAVRESVNLEMYKIREETEQFKRDYRAYHIHVLNRRIDDLEEEVKVYNQLNDSMMGSIEKIAKRVADISNELEKQKTSGG